MLREFRVDNFKSLIDVVFEPQGANLLIGRNNSGKTNLCQALRFVSTSSVFKLDEAADMAAGMRFGMTSVALNKFTVDFIVRAELPRGGERLAFEYELTVSPPRPGSGETAVRLEREVLRVDGGAFDDAVLLENVAGQGRLLHEKNSGNGAPPDADGTTQSAVVLRDAPRYVETAAPTDATMLQRLFDVEANPTANLFKSYLTWWTYYDLAPAAMRIPLHKPGDFVVLQPDGGNLASVLFGLKSVNERQYRRLMEVFRHVEPGFDVINFRGGTENNVFMFFEDRNRHALPAANASSGTLRFLALAYVLLVQSRAVPSPLYLIEEPENGLHVGVLKTLFEMADPPPDGPQLVFTSHAPYFIDLFDDHLDGVFLFDRDKGHTSITRPDAARVKAKLEEFPLGEQHFRDMLR